MPLGAAAAASEPGGARVELREPVLVAQPVEHEDHDGGEEQPAGQGPVHAEGSEPRHPRGPRVADQVDQDQPGGQRERAGETDAERADQTERHRVESAVAAVRARVGDHERRGVDQAEGDQDQPEALERAAGRVLPPVVALERAVGIVLHLVAEGVGGPEEPAPGVAGHLDDVRALEHRLRWSAAHAVDAQLDPVRSAGGICPRAGDVGHGPLPKVGCDDGSAARGRLSSTLGMIR